MCGREYLPTGGPQKYCAECIPLAESKREKQWRLDHLEEGRAYAKNWHIENPEKAKESNKRWKKENPEKVKESGRRSSKLWTEKNHDAAMAATKTWRVENPDKERTYQKKSKAKRRFLGFLPLNVPFVGCEGHHVDNEQVIYMPKSLHRSIFHRQSDGLGMAKINAVAYNYLFMQEVNHERI